MARHRPATLVHPGRHVTWYGDDAQRSRAIALLNALLGSWGRKGGFYQPGQHGRAGLPVPALPEVGAGARSTTPASSYPFADEAITTGIREATITGQPYPIKGWFVYATNLMQALPNEAETIKAIQAARPAGRRATSIPSEIAGWADVVLPEATYLERYDDLQRRARFREPFVALRQPVVAAAARPEARTGGSPASWPSKLGLGAYYPVEGHRGVPRRTGSRRRA